MRSVTSVGARSATTAGPKIGAAVLTAIILPAVLTGPNFSLALLSLAVLALGVSLLWRAGEPPILLLAFGMPWLQASVSIFHANVLGLELNAYPDWRGQMTLSTVLSLIGVAMLAVGMRFGAGPQRPSIMAESLARIRSVPLERWMLLYAVALSGSLVARTLAWTVPGLTQLMLGVAELKWVFFFTLAYASFARGAWASPLFLGPFFLELLLGVSGFFSHFKIVLFMTIVAAVTGAPRLSAPRAFGIAVLGALLLLLSLYWTAIKEDYRYYISGGTGQVVTVDLPTRLAIFGELLGDVDGKELVQAHDALIRRVAYVELFGRVLDRVPKVLPYSNGAIYADAIRRPFMPRILFPNKTVIDDTSRTSKYADLSFQPGTSVSLGYVAEAYIDFGVFGMLLVLTVLGWVYGLTYRYLFFNRPFRGPLAAGYATTVLLGVTLLDNSFTKLFGGFIVVLLAAWLVQRFVLPHWFPWAVAR